SNCNKEWFARPMWLLTKETQKHICGVDPVRMSEVTKRKNRTITETDKLKMYDMAEKGMSASKIATALGITRATVSRYLKQMEESRVLI
ncbi:helix-turn-helix domain-containing protein, partial [Bacillus sp. PBL-C9]